jgi:hypothetical protein
LRSGSRLFATSILVLVGAQCGCGRPVRETPPETIRLVSNGPYVGDFLARYQK